MQESECYVLVEVFDLLVPLVAVERGSHKLLLLCMRWAVSAQHGVPTSFTHNERCGLSPYHIEVLRPLQDILSTYVRCKVNPRRHLGGSIPGVVIFPSETAKYLFVF